MAELSLKHVYKRYPNGFEAVKDFNLDVADKEFIIFVGPSGCGKSTTLRMIAGLEEISEGEFDIDGKRMNDVEPKDRDIAMVFQNYALYPHMTVYNNMAFALKLRKVPKDEIDKKVRNAARILDLEKLLDRKPKALSGGQRQRVAMGRAIVREPKVFLMDEPLSNLDAKLRVQMRSEISNFFDILTNLFVKWTFNRRLLFSGTAKANTVTVSQSIYLLEHYLWLILHNSELTDSVIKIYNRITGRIYRHPPHIFIATVRTINNAAAVHLQQAIVFKGGTAWNHMCLISLRQLHGNAQRNQLKFTSL